MKFSHYISLSPHLFRFVNNELITKNYFKNMISVPIDYHINSLGDLTGIIFLSQRKHL